MKVVVAVVVVVVEVVDDDSGGGRPKDAQQFGSNGHLSPQTREGNTNGEKNNIHLRYAHTGCLNKTLVVTSKSNNHISGAISNTIQTRLSYNCAHLRWTKETLTIEYFRIILKKIWVKIFWAKIGFG